MTEAKMVSNCYQKLKNTDKFKEVILEVPFLSRSIDMVLVTNQDEVISIEFKLRNWKNALKQAKVHKHGVDKAYICMPRPTKGFTDEFLTELKTGGIGLYEYYFDRNIPFKEVIKAEVDQNKWLPRVESLQRMINRLTESQLFIFDN